METQRPFNDFINQICEFIKEASRSVTKLLLDLDKPESILMKNDIKFYKRLLTSINCLKNVEWLKSERDDIIIFLEENIDELIVEYAEIIKEKIKKLKLTCDDYRVVNPVTQLN